MLFFKHFITTEPILLMTYFAKIWLIGNCTDFVLTDFDTVLNRPIR